MENKGSVMVGVLEVSFLILQGVAIGMFIFLIIDGHFSQMRALCAYSTGYIDAETAYYAAMNLTGKEQSERIFSAPPSVYYGLLSCQDIGEHGVTPK